MTAARVPDRGGSGDPLADRIRRLVDEAPPLTAEQHARLAVLLAPARARAGRSVRPVREGTAA